MKTPKDLTADYLKKTGLKKYHLADLAGISRPVIYNWLNKKMDIKLATWLKIQKVIGKAR